ncbi:probable LRR receptor-like serine/threonine-protein kinase At4g29180 [Impatiens glandulifera]|uniref:probable LRR receptor-like serine/threonine-protein kinase At4g29180 n=1 Tax=Impatiens glandulifera TaxID=253017 RepID=UPI001FB14FBB|nr:probable LRR receptor-like serine/threonine-protein kinase At4g29180 [Impatiens glandulifera]
MITRIFLLISISLALTASITGQSQIGFISIDCGSPDHLSYDDPDTGIKYTSDNSFINAGISKNISTEYQYPKILNQSLPLSDLKSFPNGNKNCYSLRSNRPKGSLNLLRASFIYGNYDNQSKLPEFDLYLDVSYWFTVKFTSFSEIVITEVISVSQSDTTYVCLINKGLGTPFISSLELRPLTSSIYNLELGTNGLLVLFNRFDIGYTNGSGRYQDDTFDRIWKPYSSSPSWETFATPIDINVVENGNRAPQEVIRSFVKPKNPNDSLELYWNETDVGSRFYVYLYFAELEQLRNQSRVFNVSWNGLHLFGPISPRFRYAETAWSLTGLVAKEHRISIYRTGNSTLPPILNAIEVYTLKPLQGLLTYDQDFDAITSIITAYQLTKYWMGDPCGPQNFVWEGLQCSYTETAQPRIISLNLSSNSLTGVISTSILNLTSIQILDLSNNRLSGSIPEFLGELQSLRILNLKNNNFSGPVPTSVLMKSRNGGLNLLVDDQNVCQTRGSCKKKNSMTAIVASVTSTIALAIIVIISLLAYRNWKSGKSVEYTEDSLGTKKRKFSYGEIVQITNDFKTVVGKGGFGSVYLGRMENDDGTQVAVKMLSSSSSQGSNEFRAEAELLLRVHHRNLAPFVGYCDDNNNMALIYEYMANGNLRDFLSDNNKASGKLSWEMRIRIAIDAAQGLEYLHHGCKPPIVHRDVKSANILLSENMDAKIADFGLSKAIPSEEITHVATVVMGTRGYLDPEYYIMQNLTDKSDVYSFGIVMLELITGNHAIIKQKGEETIHIVQWVRPMLEKGEINEIVDGRMGGEYNVNSIWKALDVAVTCTRSSAIQRESMSFVLAELKECLSMEMIPRHRSDSSSQSQSTNVSSTYYVSNSSTEVFTGDIDAISGPLAR